MDKMPNNPYHELLERAFAPVHGAHRHGKYQMQRVMFKKMIFHLESPASLIFPETSTRGPQRCRDSTLFDAYRRHVLQSFNLLEVEPPSVPTASLLLRHRTAWVSVRWSCSALANLVLIVGSHFVFVEKRWSRDGQ